MFIILDICWGKNVTGALINKLDWVGIGDHDWVELGALRHVIEIDEHDKFIMICKRELLRLNCVKKGIVLR